MMLVLGPSSDSRNRENLMKIREMTSTASRSEPTDLPSLPPTITLYSTMSLTPAPSQRITTLFSHLKHVPAHKRTSSSASVSSVVEPSPALARQRVNIERKKRKRIQEDVDSDDLDEDDRPRTDDEDCQMEDAGAKQDGFDEPSLAAEILKP